MKKTLKKLEAIIAIALVLTIGGVYATFNYAQGGVDTQNIEITGSVEDAVTTTNKGTISLTNATVIKVDDTNTDLVTDGSITGNITITFTPNQGADADVANNGIVLKLQISVTGNDYNSNTLYSLSSYETACGENDYILLNSGNATKSVTVNLSDYIAVNAISLPTLADYNTYKTAFTAATITVTVSEYTETANA